MSIANQVQKLIAPVTDAALEWGYLPPPIDPPREEEMDLAEFF